MEEDPYGFCHELEREMVDVLNKKGLAAFVRRIRAKFEAAQSRDEKQKQSSRYYPSSRRWGRVLKTLLIGQGDVEAYITL